MKREGSQDIENNRHVKKRKTAEPTRPREGEEAFFSVMNDSDLWTEFKKYMYPKNVKTYNYYEYKNGDAALRCGYFGLFKERHEYMQIPPYAITIIVSKIPCDNRLDIVKILLENYEMKEGRGGIKDAKTMATDLGYLDVVKYLHQKYGKIYTLMRYASFDGHFEIIRYFHENEMGFFDEEVMNYAARKGHFEIVQFLHEHRKEGCTTDAMDLAAKKGYFKIVKFLHKNRQEGCTTDAMDFAAQKGHFEIVKFLHEHRKEGCTTWAMDKAATNGHLEIVKFLHEHRNEGCTPDAINHAAMCGRFEIVKFLCENRKESFTKYAIDRAINIARKKRLF